MQTKFAIVTVYDILCHTIRHNMSQEKTQKNPNHVATAIKESLTAKQAQLLRAGLQTYSDRTWFRKMAGDTPWTPIELLAISQATGWSLNELLNGKSQSHATRA